MTVMSKELWAAIKPLLAEALELDDASRNAWLEQLRGQSPVLADEVAALLKQSPEALDQLFVAAGRSNLLGQSLAGQVVSGYRLDRPIGRGGMGTVWLAQRNDGRFEGRAAVKLLNLALLGDAGEQRFRNEGSVLARLTHPNIARLHDAGVTAGGQPFLILEYIEGIPIDRYADEHRLTIEQRVQLMIDVLVAVGRAHANLIVHRDIKPSNILVTSDGQVKLLDFGIARMLSDGEQVTLTDPGYRALTPEYGAPEMITGQPISTATDVYSAGVTLYVLLSGVHPTLRENDTRATAIAAVVERDAAPLSEAAQAGTNAAREARASLRGMTSTSLARAFRGDLDHILAHALRRAPTERYPGAHSFADDLARYLRHEPVVAVGESFRYRAGKFLRRHRTGVLSSLLVVVALVGATAFSLQQMVTARRERDRAEDARLRAETSVAFEQLLFRLVSPGDPPLTYEQLLDKGRIALEKEYRGEPVSRIQLGITFAQNYLRGNNPERAREVVAQAAAVADSIGDAEWQGRAYCELAQVHVVMQQPDSAWSLVGKARRFLSGVRNPDAATGYACDYAEGNTLYARNKRDSAVAMFAAIVARREKAGDTTRTAYMESLNDLGRAYNGNRQPRESREILVRVIRLSREGATADPRNVPVLLYNWAVVSDALGEYRDMRTFLGRELARSYREDSVGVYAMNMFDYATVLDHLGEVDSAAFWFARTIENPAKVDSARMFTSQLMLARYAEARGQADQARAYRAGVKAFMPIATRAVPARTSWVIDRIDHARASSDGAAVLAVIREEFKAREFAPDSRLQRIAGALSAAAGALIETGRFADALPYAEHLERLGTRDSLCATRSGVVGRALLLNARATLGMGDTTRARELADRSVEPLRSGYGDGHVLTKEAVALRENLRRLSVNR